MLGKQGGGSPPTNLMKMKASEEQGYYCRSRASVQAENSGRHW